MDVGNRERAKKAARDNSINIAAMIREMELLRKVAIAAVELRAAGRSCDKVDEAMEELSAQADRHGHTKCGTPSFWAREVFNSRMEAFDNAVAEAARAGMTWATLPQLRPAEPPLSED